MKVLIADDDPVSRRLLQGYLQRWGHEVVAAADGSEAWRLFQADDFPLVISDWMMPEMDGVELIRRIRALQPPRYVYLILLTSRAHKEDLVHGMDAGADDFLTKPFDRDELRVRLREGERIIRLERSLAGQNEALRQGRPADEADRLAELRDGVRAALSLLSRYRDALPDLERAAPALASELKATTEQLDVGKLTALCDRCFDPARTVES